MKLKRQLNTIPDPRVGPVLQQEKGCKRHYRIRYKMRIKSVDYSINVKFTAGGNYNTQLRIM